jgi:hypothetical protein
VLKVERIRWRERGGFGGSVGAEFRDEVVRFYSEKSVGAIRNQGVEVWQSSSTYCLALVYVLSIYSHEFYNVVSESYTSPRDLQLKTRVGLYAFLYLIL